MMSGALSFNAVPTVNLLEVMAPPQGYRFERLLALTYSLDARVAVALLSAAFGLEKAAEDEKTFDLKSLNPFEVRAFIRRVLLKSLFLVHHSGDPIKGAQGTISADVASLLEDRIFTISISGMGATGDRALVNFHPKFIAVEFTNNTDHWMRIYVGSRNLCLGTARESGIVLELHPNDDTAGRRLPGAQVLRPLRRFLEAVEHQAFGGTNKLFGIARHVESLRDWKASFQAMIQTGRRFLATRPIKQIELWPQWPGSRALSKPIFDDLSVAKKVIIVSPWLDKTAAQCLADKVSRNVALCLWTLESERANLEPLRGRRADIVTEASDSLYEEGIENEPVDIGFDLRHHAKVYALDNGKGGALWLGSANFTKPGVGLEKHPAANFELLLRIKARGSVTRWFGRLPTEKLDRVLERTDQKTTKKTEQRPLDWLYGIWTKYPKRLEIRLRKPAKAGLIDDGYLQSIAVDGTSSEGDRVRIGRIDWKSLWRTGKAQIATKLDPRIELDALLTLLPEGRPDEPVSFLQVPVPDVVASERIRKIVDKPVSIDLAIERLIELQNATSQIPGRRKNGSGKKRTTEEFLSGLRLEKLFLRLVEDESDEIAHDLKEIISCLKRDRRARIRQGLIHDLEIISAQALKLSRVRT